MRETKPFEEGALRHVEVPRFQFSDDIPAASRACSLQGTFAASSSARCVGPMGPIFGPCRGVFTASPSGILSGHFIDIKAASASWNFGALITRSALIARATLNLSAFMSDAISTRLWPSIRPSMATRVNGDERDQIT